MPRLFNRHRADVPASAVYIGRPGPYGNPFAIGKDGDRAKVIELYTEWIRTQPDLLERVRRELRGKDLVCFCAPCPCHGDVLLKLANE